MREKSLLDHTHDYGITCSYDEVLRFKSFAAQASCKNKQMRGLYENSKGLIQACADNFDAQISSANG